MQRTIVTLVLAFILLSGSFAQETDKDKEKSQPMSKQEPSKVYWGGQLGLSFGSFFRIAIIPMVGYKVTPRFHVGGTLGYSYTKDTSSEKLTVTSHNFGGSVFTRYLIVKGLYGHVEYAYWSYKYQIEDIEGERRWVPFLLVGGGYIQPISPSTSIFIEALWDVLQDENSPYDSSSPFVSIGVGVGFTLGKIIGKLIDMPVSTSLYLGLGVVIFAIFTTVISGLYPAFRASNLHPVEALRSE